MASPQIQPRIVKFGCQDTRRNLPRASSCKRGESNFLSKFERAYLDAELRKLTRLELASGREFALDGYGRADVVFMAWTHPDSDADFTAMALKSLRITAIEAKISDWRKGLMQAARYRFFSNRALLVLPPEVCGIALNYLVTFRNLNVGLWQFNPDSGVIRKHFTPRYGQPLNSKAREKALQLISAKLKLR